MAKLIDGRAIAEKVYVDLRREIAKLKSQGVTPGLAVVLVGDLPASRAYVRSKDKMSRELGLHSVKLELPASTTQSELLSRVEELNRDPAIHGILVQSPPPKQIDEATIVRALDPGKDVDGFHPLNVAKLASAAADGFVPCTPLGIQRLLIESKIDISGAHVVILGRSMIVGKPLALLLMQKGRGSDATVTVVHSRSRNLEAITRAGDILIDGGNTFYKDDIRRAKTLESMNIAYVDVGTSGGVWGLERGYCMMIGGPKAAVDRLDPIFKALAPGIGTIARTPGRNTRDPRAEHGYILAGPAGAGHFVKMIHNGIEYGLMQAYAEGFGILRGKADARLPESERGA